MPGFTSAQTALGAKHEPQGVRALPPKVLLPKAWLRLEAVRRLHRRSFSDVPARSARRRKRLWSENALAACGLTLDHSRRVVEGQAVWPENSHRSLAARWGMQRAAAYRRGSGPTTPRGSGGRRRSTPGLDAFVASALGRVVGGHGRFAAQARSARLPPRLVTAVPTRQFRWALLLSAASSLCLWAGVHRAELKPSCCRIGRANNKRRTPVGSPALSAPQRERAPAADQTRLRAALCPHRRALLRIAQG